MRDSEELMEPCEVCGISPDDQLIPAAYEVIWDALPELRTAQDAGETTYCPECGRQLTGPNLVSGDPLNW